jgi:Fe-S cluster assembly protein SufD
MLDTLQNPVLKPHDPVMAQFDRFAAAESERWPHWLTLLRKTGLAQFTKTGFPATRHEEWRFTNVAPLAQMPFKPVFKAATHGLSVHQIAGFFLDGPSHRLVFVDGHYCPILSDPGPRMDGFKIGSMASALTLETPLIEKHLGTVVPVENNPFAALNTAFFQDGAFIALSAGVKVANPIHLLFLFTTPDRGANAHPRNFILARKDSQALIVETYVHWAGKESFTNAVTEVRLDEGAQIEHVKMQDEGLEAFHIGSVFARQATRSHFASHSISIGARLLRNQIQTVFDEGSATSLLNGLYLVSGSQLADHHTVIDHASPDCSSHQFYNGIMGGAGKGVFNGKIFVRKDAQKTDAKQTSRNLLLSDDATIDAKPQLEIFADDVKCTHGATVGQLDEDSVFYLRARGIGEADARQMLVHGFAQQVYDRISNIPVRTYIDKAVTERLTSGFWGNGKTPSPEALKKET